MSGGGKEVQKQDGERAIADVAAAGWARYKDRYAPLEKDFIDQARVDEVDRSLITGRATADLAQAENNPRFSYGVGAPGSGRYVDKVTTDGINSGARRGAGINTVNNVGDDLNTRGLQKAIGIGRDIADTSNQGLRRNASLELRNAANEVATSNSQRRLVSDAVGGLAGMASGSWLNAPKQSTSPLSARAASVNNYDFSKY